MAVTFPYVRAAVWADGSTTDTAAKRNTIEDGIFNAHQAPAVRVTHNTTQSVAHNTEQALIFNTERYDQAGGATSTQHDTVTNNSRLTCRYAGVYEIVGDLEWPATTSASRLSVRLNGTTVIGRAQINGTVALVMNVVTHYALAVNDYVELMAFQQNGGSTALTVASSGNYSPEFMMVRVA